MISFQTYQKIQEHKAYGASMLRTSQIMGLSYNTVYKWWDLTGYDFNAFQSKHEFVLDNYRQYFIEQLKITPQMNNTLLYKRLKDDFGDEIEVPISTFHRYIKSLREQTGYVKPQRKMPDKAFDHGKITKGLQWQLQRIEQIDFRNKMENFVIVGDCATGKTSLATEIGGYALAKLAKVQYISQENLLLAIRNQSPRWKTILKSDMIIIDDVFYIAPTDAELTTFYKAITFLSETHSLVIVTNRKLSGWKDMGADRNLADTLRKRLLANAQLIHLK